MSDYTIQIDEEKAARKLSWREKCAIKILMLLFCIVYPARYQHELEKVFRELFEGFTN